MAEKEGREALSRPRSLDLLALDKNCFGDIAFGKVRLH